MLIMPTVFMVFIYTAIVWICSVVKSKFLLDVNYSDMTRTSPSQLVDLCINSLGVVTLIMIVT
jgi:hypothetical protein